jgi:multiple sugar transport system substrate-binding protein
MPTMPSRIISLCAVILVAAGCGSGEEGGDGRIELRFSWWGNNERAEATEQAIAAFEAANPGITVTGETSDFNAYFDRLALQVASDEAPDVITMGGAYPSEYGGRGALLDLATVSDVLRTEGIDQAALSNGVFDGTRYGVPTGVNTYAMVADPTWFEAAGLAVPDDETWTWDEFIRIAEELAAGLPEDTYALPDPTAAETLALFAGQRGESFYTPEGGLGITAATLTDWWTATTRLRDSGATPPADLTAELATQSGPEQTLMGRGQAAMQFEWSNQLTALREASGRPLVLLEVPGESAGVGPGMWVQASQLYTISAGTEHPEEAARLVDFLINNEEAGKIILTDRGIPSNRDVLAAIQPSLSDEQRAEAGFVAEVLPAAAELVVGPVGSTETPGILDRLNEEVLFDRMSPAEAAGQTIDEITVAIS